MNLLGTVIKQNNFGSHMVTRIHGYLVFVFYLFFMSAYISIQTCIVFKAKAAHITHIAFLSLT